MEEGGGQSCEVFIGGVPLNLTSETLQSVMQANFGPVTSVNWREGRTFQFVTFMRPDSAATALATGQAFQLPDGQSIQIRPAKRQKSNNSIPMHSMVPPVQMLPVGMSAFPMPGAVMNAGPAHVTNSAPPFSESDKLQNYKLLVNGLPPHVTQADIVNYFAQFGQVVEVSFLSPGSCHVRLQNAQRRGDVVITRHGQHVIAGAAVEVADTTDGVVFVNRVPADVSTDQLRDYMSAVYGLVLAVDRPKDTGYVFCVFESEAAAAATIAAGSDPARGFTFGPAKPRGNRSQQAAQRQQQQQLKRSFEEMMLPLPLLPPHSLLHHHHHQQHLPLAVPNLAPPPAFAHPPPAMPPAVGVGVGGGGAFTLHVSNIPLDATSPLIASYFGHFGTCTPADVKMMRKDGRPQNYCFVTLSNAVPLPALLEGQHMLGGTPIRVGLAKEQAAPSIPNALPLPPNPAPSPAPLLLPAAAAGQPPPVSLQAGGEAGGGGGGVGSTYTLHVSNLPPDASGPSLAAYFSQFGACAPGDVRMMHKDGRLQNYCFVTVSNAAVPMQMLLDGAHMFGHVQLHVRVAKHQALPALPPHPAPLF